MDNLKDPTRQLKKLSLKFNYIKEEQIDIENEVQLGKWELNLSVSSVFARSGLEIPVGQVQDRQVDEDNKDEEFENDPICKKIFRKIAIKVHPDKLIGADANKRILYEQFYNEAANAVSKNNKSILFKIASILEIEIDIDPEIQLSFLKDDIEKIEKSISDHKKSVPYIWITSKNDKNKLETLLSLVIKQLNSTIDKEHIEKTIEWACSGFPADSTCGIAVPAQPQRRAPLPRKPGERPVFIKHNR